MNKERSINTLLLDGGCHCFNFVNTIHSRKDQVLHDYLKSYDDLLKWSEKVDLLSGERIKMLRYYAKKKNKEAEKILSEIKRNRELMYRIFSSIINKKNYNKPAVEEFNESLFESMSYLAFKFTNDEIILGWETNKIDLKEPLRVVYKDAFDLLTTVSRDRLKECKSCGWLFLDRSKNNSRTWCNMQTCGSIEKSKRYYHRKKHIRPK